MIRILLSAGLLVASLGIAQAQTAESSEPAVSAEDSSTTASGGSIADLLAQGYEIKAAVPNGKKFVVFLQKEQSAFACEFASVANSRCGEFK